MLICFIGIDGSGKTTYALKLYQELKTKGFKCRYIHFDSLFAHTVLNIANKIANLATTKTKHAKLKDSSEKRASSFISTIKGTIWSLILIIDGIFFNLLKLKKKREIVICDRYFYDSAISCIYSGAKESFIYKIYQQFFLLPDIMFLMDVEPKTAYNRKQDESLKYLARKRELYLKLYSTMPMTRCKKIKVDSSNHFDSSFGIVLNKSLELLIGESK